MIKQLLKSYAVDRGKIETPYGNGVCVISKKSTDYDYRCCLVVELVLGIIFCKEGERERVIVINLSERDYLLSQRDYFAPWAAYLLCSFI